MENLLGKTEAEAPIFAGGKDGTLTLHEKGLVYDGPGVNGKIIAPYTYVEKLEKGKELMLGKMEVRLVLMSALGERFDLKFAIAEHYYHVLKAKVGR